MDFHPIRRSDFALVGEWLATPHVARWWAADPSLEAIEADFGGCVDGIDPAEVFMVHRAGAPLGLIQRYRIHAYPQYVAEIAPLLAVTKGAWSIDYFVGPAHALKKGLGSAMIEAFVRRLWQDAAEASCIVVPTNARNRASWRSLERAGFRHVATGDLTPDNPIDDPRHFIYRADRSSGI